MNPSDIIRELQELTAENKKGVDALYEAETNLARTELELDQTEAGAFISATGNIAERSAVSKLESSEARFQRDLAKAQVNRVRTKLRVIESAIMAQATMSKLLQAEMKL